MKRDLIIILFAAAVSVFSNGTAAAQSRSETGLLTNTRIAAMVKNGVSESVILSLIEKFPDKLDSGPDALVELRSAGASNAVLLAVRRGALTRQAEASALEEAAADGDTDESALPAEEAEDADTPGLVQKDSRAAQGKTGLFKDGRYSVGLGYPFLAVKYDFADYAAEGRFLTRNGVQAYSARGYWNFHKTGRWHAYTGPEAGYVRFGSGRYAGSGAELAAFIGGGYALDKDFSITADIAPTLIIWPKGGGTDLGIGDLGWYVNIGIYFRLPKLEPRSPHEAHAANAAATDREDADDEISGWRLAAAPPKVSYEDYLTQADRHISQKDYASAAGQYAKALAVIPEDDPRRVLLYERRGWLALKEKDLPRARDFYLAAVTAAKETAVYDTNTVNAYCGLAYCFEKLDNIRLAIRNYERALDITASESALRAIEKTLRRLNSELPPQE